MSKIKVFVIYHQAGYLIKSDMFQPILTGAYEKECPVGMIGDHTGDNISIRNANYGEFTAHYWVMKNYLPQCEEEYIGFCHYRRFFDWNIKKGKKYLFSSISIKNFNNIRKKFNTRKIYDYIKDYDIIINHKMTMDLTLMEQYAVFHPAKDMQNAIRILEQKYPEYIPYVSSILNGNSGYFCLNFTMKKTLIANFFEWSQSILDELYKSCDFSTYTTYATIRAPAYIMERLFNVWLAYHIKNNGIKILELDSYLIEFPTIKKGKLKRSCRKRVEELKSLIYKFRSFFTKK